MTSPGTPARRVARMVAVPVIAVCVASCSGIGSTTATLPPAPPVVTSPPATPVPTEPSATPAAPSSTPAATLPTKAQIARQFNGIKPTAWGDHIAGVMTVLPVKKKVIALTFDACGWGKGSGYDKELIDFLVKKKIPATLFISGKWIEDNPGKLEYLAAQKNFEIENHGYRHKPLSVNGRSAYNIKGTASPAEVYDEIEDNAARIEQLTGRRPVFFRTGTGFYDNVAIKIATQLGARIAGFTIAADAGATYSKAQILAADSSPRPGSILLFHMNHPEGQTYEGFQALYGVLVSKGYSFTTLANY